MIQTDTFSADHFLYTVPFPNALLYGNPENAYDNIQAFSFPGFIFVAPHAIFLGIPIRTGRAVHSSSTTAWFRGR